MKLPSLVALSVLAFAACDRDQAVQAPSRVGFEPFTDDGVAPARAQGIIYGHWLSVVDTGIDPTGAPWAKLRSNPSTFCTWPGGIIWGWAPWVAPPAHQISGHGNGDWLFKYFQLGVEQQVSGAFQDSCGNVYHSNTVRFTVLD
jgi:hypothetical protein